MARVDKTHYEYADHPDFAPRFIIVFAIFVLFFTLAASMPRTSLPDSVMNNVSDKCASPDCLATRQLITVQEAWRIKRQLRARALLVDIRSAAESSTSLPLASDAQVPFMEAVADSAGAQGTTPRMEFRIDFGHNVDEALRAAQMRHEDPVILMSQSRERAVLAALLLQERGYSRVLVMHD
jgi:rhodanese-related sulfurtransferase